MLKVAIKELSNLRSKLNPLGRDKESAFRELRSLRDKIKFRTDRIKVLKRERDNLTTQVKSNKEQRDHLNQEVKEKSTEKREVDEKKKVLLEKLKIDEDPVQIKIMIQKLETKIETEPMPFEQEKKITKKIKELKAKFKELEKLGTQWSEINQTFTFFHLFCLSSQD